MPAPSPDAAGRPAADSVFSASGDLATEVTRIADGDSRNIEALHALDPDQVDGAHVGGMLHVVVSRVDDLNISHYWDTSIRSCCNIYHVFVI